MESITTERENFWNAKSFIVVTDHTKPAMKWAISELKKRGKTVYIVDLSENPESGAFKEISELPPGLDRAVLGVTKTEPGELIPALHKKGVTKIWLHWRTETEKALDACKKEGLECTIEHCPMLYLGSGLSMHGIHRGIAKITGKY